MFALFLGPALLLPGLRLTLLGTGLAFGTLAGFVRMLQGAHFLSDVLVGAAFGMGCGLGAVCGIGILFA